MKKGLFLKHFPDKRRVAKRPRKIVNLREGLWKERNTGKEAVANTLQGEQGSLKQDKVGRALQKSPAGDACRHTGCHPHRRLFQSLAGPESPRRQLRMKAHPADLD